ncbi:MutS-related protein [Microbacter margulisiae]|uniref:DNA mismatch repair ATPase MutS n=1 Tax=Microbacter margulisiae TaxID=1350067 RepID=A0A7W5H2C6_9PORP|nr:hypothetical protein [Microbacter margulisiae]MBB3187489.1 DNA mismatch repair ATPase MutS [Microbacter margulisiae]
MLIDTQTLYDLEILHTEDDGTPVFHLINQTKTTGGSYRLRDKLMHPPGSYELLIEQQEAIRYFSENHDQFHLPANDIQMKAIEEYFTSNIEVVANDHWITSVQFCLSDIASFRFLKSSLPEVIRFAAMLQQMIRKDTSELPLILKQIEHQLQLIEGDASFQSIKDINREQAISFHHCLKADRALRTVLKEPFMALIDAYYELDALLSMAVTTVRLKFQFPEIINTGQPLFQVEAMYHPLLKNAIPACVDMNQERNFIFLTGANMSGKTTFLKTIGLSVYFAHLGMGVPAKKARIAYVDRLITGITFTDNIAIGYSYFFSEVKRIRQLAVALHNGERVFSIFDELFRGTNIKDAVEASTTIMQQLLPWKDDLFIISSHLTEISPKIMPFSNVQFLCFESFIKDGKPSFTYTLQEGVSTMRLGMKIIENEGINQLLVRKMP